MESYIYKTQKGELGYFQIENGSCYTFPMDNSTIHVGKGDWDRHFAFERHGSSYTGTQSLTDENIREGIAYFLTKHLGRGGISIVNKIQTHDAGLYFYRINRGEPLLSDTQILSYSLLDEVRAYENITESLIDIFRTLEPETNNFNAYGNKTRELLIISCTEVEYLLKKFFTDNNKPPARSFYTTSDYVSCLPILKLEQYCVEAMLFPGLGTLTPFLNWSASKPTKSLSWYDAYNEVKHDRGGTKNKATLKALLDSIAAIHILLESQYGKELFEYRFQHTFRTIFQTKTRPTWNLSDYTTPLLTNQKVEWLAPKTYP